MRVARFAIAALVAVPFWWLAFYNPTDRIECFLLLIMGNQLWFGAHNALSRKEVGQ